MCPEDNDIGDEEFKEMMKRWGINSREEEEKVEPLGINILIEKWCESKFENPYDAMKALKEGERHIEASAALFGYCYKSLAPSLFGWTIDQCLEYEQERIDRLPRSKLDPEYFQEELDYHKDQVDVFHLLKSFETDFSSDQVIYPEDRDNRALKACVDVLLAAARALLVFSRERKSEYDIYFNEALENAYETVKEGKVREAENFAELEFHDDGRHLSGDVVGFLACLGCAVVCYSLAQTVSRLRPEYDRDNETAFKAYVRGAEYMLKTGYRIGFFDELFAGEKYYETGDENEIGDAYWSTIDIWEQLKKNPEKVKNWQELRSYLLKLENIMYEEGHDADIGLYPVSGPGYVYLHGELSFCNGRLSQGEIRQLVEQQRKDQHKHRLLNDFFEGLWQYLEDKTKDYLVEAEHKWYDNRTEGSRIAAFIDYSKALEEELHAIIFQNPDAESCVRTILRKIKDDDGYRKLMGLSSLAADSLYLSDMSKLLRYVRDNQIDRIWPDIMPIEKTISTLPIPEDVESEKNFKAFLSQKEFTSDLSDIYSIRNFSVHRLRQRNVLSRIYDLRNRILGIGCAGYLRKLAVIKKYTAQIK